MSQQSPPSQQWEEHREKIIQLWSEQNLTLVEVMSTMGKLGFHATPRMYKAQLKSWGLRKNATENDWLGWAKIMQACVAGTTPQIKIHNKIRQISDLRKWLRDHKLDETEFLLKAKDWGGPVPSHVRLCSSDTSGEGRQYPADGGKTPDLMPLIDPYTFHGIFEADQGYSGPGSNQHGSPGLPLPLVETGHRPSNLSDFPEHRHGPVITSTKGLHSGRQATTEIQGDADGDQEAPGQINSDHTPSLGVGSAQMSQDAPHDIRANYVVACEYAALKGHVGMSVQMKHWLARASSHFQQLCQSRDKEVLVVASVMLTWLKIHVNANVAERVMRAALLPARQTFGPKDPISTTIDWMTLMTDPERLRASHFTASIMRCIWANFSQKFGDQHPHTIVALYGYCFHLMLVEKGYSEAQVHLTMPVENSIAALGDNHVFTINVLATLARAQRRLKQLELALQTIEKAIAHTPLGRNHPHRLELLFRKAITLRKLGRDTEAEELYWLVAKGRIATLGQEHEKTQSAHESLTDVLKTNGTWDLRKDEAHQILTDPQIAVKDYESWWKDDCEAAGTGERDDLASSDESDGL